MAEPERRLEVDLPDELVPGVYANAAGVWHTPYEFTVDFLSLLLRDPEAPDVVPCRVVARIKLPPTVIFDLIRALNANMTVYEARFGEIHRIEPNEPEDET
ncbi:MAG TPA: DUF3467 domain-containing protein [Gaiellaceae bacterium]